MKHTTIKNDYTQVKRDLIKLLIINILIGIGVFTIHKTDLASRYLGKFIQ